MQGGRYKLRAKVDIADVSDEHSVWVRFGTDAEGIMQPGALTTFSPSESVTFVVPATECLKVWSRHVLFAGMCALVCLCQKFWLETICGYTLHIADPFSSNVLSFCEPLVVCSLGAGYQPRTS